MSGDEPCANPRCLADYGKAVMRVARRIPSILKKCARFCVVRFPSQLAPNDSTDRGPSSPFRIWQQSREITDRSVVTHLRRARSKDRGASNEDTGVVTARVDVGSGYRRTVRRNLYAQWGLVSRIALICR